MILYSIQLIVFLVLFGNSYAFQPHYSHILPNIKVTKLSPLRSKLSHTTALKSVPISISTLNKTPGLVGGLIAGGLHAVTGPDHLAAILPSSIGKSELVGLQIGATWGLGHGISAMILGSLAYYLKGQLSGKFIYIEKLSNLAESAVGLSVLIIGALGIKECLETDDHHEEGQKPDKKFSYGAILFNGLLHGFSWDGASCIAPTITMTSWKNALTFLLSYSIGTMIAMSISAGLIAGLSTKLGNASSSPDTTRKLSLGSSIFAVLIGLYWIIQSFRK